MSGNPAMDVARLPPPPGPRFYLRFFHSRFGGIEVRAYLPDKMGDNWTCASWGKWHHEALRRMRNMLNEHWPNYELIPEPREAKGVILK
jgi:hypothetical protein